MYILYKAVNQQNLGIIQQLGRWMEYGFGYLPDSHVDIVDYKHLNIRVLEEKVAKCWMFIGAYQESISVRTGTPQNEQLQILSSHEATGEKTKYYLTEDDKLNTALLMKSIMRYTLDEIFDKRILQLNMHVSDLEKNSWEQQKAEANLYSNDNTSATPLLTSLASARGISIDEMVNKVLTAIENYNTQLQTLLSKKQGLETEVKQCVTIADCCRLMHNKFEIQMSLQQQTEEGIEHGSKFDI